MDELKITPAHVKRLVDTALELDHEQPLKPAIDERELAEGLYEVPALTKSWARATEGLLEKLEREGQEPRRRPITFEAATARGRHDIVLAHLGHPLVDMSARLLRAAVWSGQTGLHRVTAVISDDPAVEHTLAGAYSRFVAVGADGIRLHEEVLYAGGWLRDDGTFRRVEGLGELARILDRALSQGTPAAPVIQDRLVAQWPKARDSLLLAIERRTDERFRSLQAKLATRLQDERRQIVTSFERFAATLRKALAESDTEEGALFSVAEGRGDEQEVARIGYILDDLLGWQGAVQYDDLARLTLDVPEHETAITPSFALTDPGSSDIRLLGLISDDSPVARIKGSDWPAAPTDRLAQLCRHHGVELGLATDGRWWALVWAPAGGVTTVAVFDAISWPDLSERAVVRAFISLLQRRRFFAVPPGRQLPALLRESLNNQEEITDRLGVQVRQAVELLVAAFGRAGIGADVTAYEVYRGAVAVMMRIVFRG